MEELSPSKQLFRKEVLERGDSNSLGTVFLRQPKEYQWIAILMFLVVSGLLVFLFVGTYTKYADVFGVITVDKGLVKVSARREGQIIEQLVEQGDSVTKGDLLYVISTDRHSSFDQNLDQTILTQQMELQSSLERDLKIAEEASGLELALIKSKILSKTTEIEQINAQLAIYDQRVELSGAGLARNEKLLKAGHTNQAQLDKVIEEHLALKSKRNDLLMKLNSTQSLLAELTNELELKPGIFKEKHNRLKRNLIENKQRITEVSSNIDYRIYAPLTGVIGSQLTHVGEFVRPGNTMVSLIPQGSKLQAELYVPATSIGFIKPAQEVSMRYSAFPYQHFGLHSGRVLSVSKVISLPEELETSVELTGAVYKVIVGLDSQSVSAQGEELSLGVGMELEASVKLENRSLVQWILEPIYSLRNR
ncbi:HlyD family secretion protein [Shewanella nanhaiensis]|uniref:HlyD family efflux transporter periplasmic adaptor subunit n=1 Tax=Shewanella nanhaiensis TaxID=2864872 RepID=A0ABS7E4U8_9GAMM|nr:HlyD family efflux transporter periplasmic adaptor subunit [Shewanella nanhaiensis]MBW8184156.1 HlyD family efflux transporter periplasmic adaptor subunit [Shewanella nanhaiensis]